MNIRVFTELRTRGMSDQEKNAFLESDEYLTFCNLKFYEQLTTVNNIRKVKPHIDDEDDQHTFSARYRCHA